MAFEDIDFVFGDFNTPGVPSSGNKEPEKRRIRNLFHQITDGAAVGSVARGTLAGLNSVTTKPDGATGYVYNDPDATKNGIYARSGGAWVRQRGFPDSIAKFGSVSGTANAVTAVISAGVDPSTVVAFIIKPVSSNTGNVTLNGKPVLNVSGAQLAAGEWPAGRYIMFTDEGANYQLISDPAVAALLSQAISLYNSAVSTGTPADGVVTDPKVADAYAAVLPVTVATRTALKALSTTRYKAVYLIEAGREGLFLWKAGNYSTQVTADPNEGVYVKATAIAASAGAWVRSYNGTPDIRWFGAVAGTGTNNSSLINSTPDAAAVIDNSGIRLATAGTVGTRFEWIGRGYLIVDGINVNLTEYIDAPNEKPIFQCINGGTITMPNGEVSLGWFDGLESSATAIINHLLANGPENGRSIWVPDRKYTLPSPILIPQKNFLSIRGSGANVRSNIEYEKAIPTGGGASVEYPGGGSAFIMGAACDIGIAMVTETLTDYRRSGITIDGISVIGKRMQNMGVTQTGIYLAGLNDRFTLRNSNIINCDTAFIGLNMDAALIEGNWICENSAGLNLQTGKSCKIIGNIIGGTPGFVSANYVNQDYLTDTGNTYAGDGSVCAAYTTCYYGESSGNSYNARFVGAVIFTGDESFNWTGNNIKLPYDRGTSWTAGKSAYAATNYDPNNRDDQFGIVQVINCNDSMFSQINLRCHAPTNYVGLNVLTGGAGNAFYDWNISGSASTKKMVHAGATGSIIRNVAKSGETVIASGSPSVTYKP